MIPKFPLDRVNWTSSSFLIATFFTAVIGTPWFAFTFGLDWFYVGLFFFFFITTGLSITLGYHRLFAHKAFKAGRSVRLTTLLFGACAFEDSALDWASDHRDHHKNVDHEDDDPYSISRGFFWAHIGWIFFKMYPRTLDNVADLKKDPLVMWQHRYHRQVALLMGLGLPTLLGALYDGWVGALGGFLIGGVTRLVAVQHCTFFINSLCHTIGSRPYDASTSARDSSIMALFTFGEGYHNYHHSFQHDYRNGVKAWHWDPTKWTIWTLSKLGLVSDLREVSAEKIVLAELREAQKHAHEHIAKVGTGELVGCPALRAAHVKLEEISQSLGESYRELEKAAGEKMKLSRQNLRKWRRQAAEAHEHFILMRDLQTGMA